ncbi:DUF305 domain-containing protein [Micromonospora chersina]|uniref:DUF305 domain-containing protein n=1 Tax=Micromonospora chersina TaxID=47854 RepID=UPI00371A3EA6
MVARRVGDAPGDGAAAVPAGADPTGRLPSGTDFDRQFLTMMIAHHEGAITMAKEEIARGAHPDATALARQIVTTQQGEIDAMRKMLDRL